MVKRFSLLIIMYLAFCASVFGSEAPYYERPGLKEMPLEAQRVFEDAFKRLSLQRAFIGESGSKELGLNMLFTDRFFLSKIAVKFDVKGNFAFNKVYNVENYKLIHFKYGDKSVGVLYQNISDSSIEKFKSLVEANRRKAVSGSFNVVTPAYADECFRPEIAAPLHIDTQLSESSAAAMITKCFSNMGEGVKDSTVGVAQGIWNGISSEASKLWENPFARFNDYVKYVDKGISLLWDFGKTLGKMIIDPVYGAALLKQKFGQAGEFFVQMYENLKSLPFESKVEAICNVVGAVGVDALIAALTLGSAGGKLGLTAARIFLKLQKVSSLVGKGVALPFRLLNELGRETLETLENLVSSGYKNILERKLKRGGCAL